jgi:hypothetical protein
MDVESSHILTELQCNLIKQKRILYCLTERKEIYELDNFVHMLTNSYKGECQRYEDYHPHLNFKHTKKIFSFDEDFDLIMHDLPEPLQKSDEKLNQNQDPDSDSDSKINSNVKDVEINNQKNTISKKDMIKQIFKDLAECIEKKEELENKLNILLND